MKRFTGTIKKTTITFADFEIIYEEGENAKEKLRALLHNEMDLNWGESSVYIDPPDTFEVVK